MENLETITDLQYYFECELANANHNIFLGRHSKKFSRIKQYCLEKLAELNESA